MADTLKVLSQTTPGAATLTDAYTVPSTAQAMISSVVVCNRGAATSFRVSVAVAGAADATKQYLYFDLPISANDTFIFTIGVSLGPADVIRVYNTLATLTFSVFGVEVTLSA